MKSIRMKLTSNLIIENISTFYVNFSVNFYFQDIYISFSIFKMKMIYKPRAIKFQRANTWKEITSWYFFSVKLNKENTYKMQKVRIQVWKYFNKPKNAIICEWDSQKIHDHFPETDTLVRGPFCILTWRIREQNMFPLFIMQRVFRGYLLRYKFDE